MVGAFWIYSVTKLSVQYEEKIAAEDKLAEDEANIAKAEAEVKAEIKVEAKTTTKKSKEVKE